MANKKQPYMKFETQEDYEKHFDEVFLKGQIKGFENGSIWVLSYIYELLEDMFKPEAFKRAQDEIRYRRIEQWRKENNLDTLKRRIDKKREIKELFEG